MRGEPGSYVEITRDMEDRRHRRARRCRRRCASIGCPTTRSAAAVVWGPLVLAGDLGPQPRRAADGDGDGPHDRDDGVADHS